MVRTFERYLDDIGRERMLTREEEIELARRGDEASRARLVSANLRFVVAVARRYRGRGVPLADLVNEGNLGLIRAADRFDETRGVRFITYAAWWVRQAMFRAVEQQRYWGTGRAPLSIDEPAIGSRGACVGELLADEREDPEACTARAALRAAVDVSLTGLPDREALVLRLYYGLDDGVAHPMEEVASRLRVTRERARQIKDRGLARLRSEGARSTLSAFAEAEKPLD